ncbi:MAG: DUF3822 family protein [Bacteroidales bacterium]|nr:DUF3822 family protein [Bacteroidales bacterium]
MSDPVTTFITTDKAVANNELRLSICLRPNGFSFCVTTIGQELLTFGETDFDMNRPLGQLTASLTQFFADHGIATFGLKQTRLIVPSEHFVWVPAHLYDGTRDRQYLDMTSSPVSGLSACRCYSSSQDSYMVFAAPTNVVTAFKIALPGIDVLCQHSVLVNDVLKQRSTTHPVIVMHVREGVGDYEAYYGGLLLLSNTFPSVNADELVYHALEVMKKLHTETPDMELAICGAVGREIYGLLQHYFPKVTLYTGIPITYSNPQFQLLHTYRYALLLS